MGFERFAALANIAPFARHPVRRAGIRSPLDRRDGLAGFLLGETMVYTFDTEVAKLVGADAAAIFQNIAFWCAKNAVNGKDMHEGRAWTYNSARAFAELFPWLSADRIRRALKKLEGAGLIVSGCFNKAPYDRTKWYAIADSGLRFCHFDLAEMQNRNGENTTPIPDGKPVTKPTKNTNKDKRAIERTCISRRGYGEYRNVLLSDEELAKLKAEFPDDWASRIEAMSNWCAANGKAYKNYLAALRNWARRETASKAGSKGGVVDGTVFDAIGAAIGSQRP